MPTVSLATIRADVQTLGDYENSASFTPEFLNGWINKAIERYYEAVVDAYEGYYDKTSAPIVTVAGTQEYALPFDFFRLRLVEKQLAPEQYVPMRRLTLVETTRFQDRGTPRGYMLYGGLGQTMPGRIRVWPIPDNVYTFRLTYIPVAPVLELDTDEVDLLPGGESLVIAETLLALDKREGRPLGERIGERDEAKARILGMAPRRDSAEPEYLVPRTYNYWTEDD